MISSLFLKILLKNLLQKIKQQPTWNDFEIWTRFAAVGIRVETFSGIFISSNAFRNENFSANLRNFFRLYGFGQTSLFVREIGCNSKRMQYVGKSFDKSEKKDFRMHFTVKEYAQYFFCKNNFGEKFTLLSWLKWIGHSLPTKNLEIYRKNILRGEIFNFVWKQIRV